MWSSKKLGDICYIHSGNSINEKIKRDKYTNINEGRPYVATKDISFEGSINYNNGISIPISESNKFKISRENSTLVCAEGGSAGRKIAFSYKSCHFVNKLFSIEPNGEVEPKFIYYYTLGKQFQSQFKNNLTGLIGGVSLKKIKSFEISLPTSSEQKKIIKKIDLIFSEINESINETKKNLTKFDDLKQSILISELSKKIV